MFLCFRMRTAQTHIWRHACWEGQSSSAPEWRLAEVSLSPAQAPWPAPALQELGTLPLSLTAPAPAGPGPGTLPFQLYVPYLILLRHLSWVNPHLKWTSPTLPSFHGFLFFPLIHPAIFHINTHHYLISSSLASNISSMSMVETVFTSLSRIAAGCRRKSFGLSEALLAWLCCAVLCLVTQSCPTLQHVNPLKTRTQFFESWFLLSPRSSQGVWFSKQDLFEGKGGWGR